MGGTVASAFVPSIEVTGLVVRYGDLSAVDGLGFEAGAGEVVALLGPNGAGKTTTVETLEGYRAPSSGQVRVLDSTRSRPRPPRPRIGVMLQSGGVYPGARAAEVLRCRRLLRRPRDPASCSSGWAGRPAKATWRQLSGASSSGSRWHCAGRTPEVAFLDEPTAGVDVGGRRYHQAVRDLRDSGVVRLLTPTPATRPSGSPTEC